MTTAGAMQDPLTAMVFTLTAYVTAGTPTIPTIAASARRLYTVLHVQGNLFGINLSAGEAHKIVWMSMLSAGGSVPACMGIWDASTSILTGPTAL